MDNSVNPNELPEKTILPNGCFNLVFISGLGIDLNVDSTHVHLKEGVYLYGQAKTGIKARINAFTKLTMAQLHPWVAASISRFSFDEIANSFIPIREINLSMGNHLRQFEPSDEKMIVSFLSEKFPNFLIRNSNNSLIKDACDLIRRERGIISVKELSAKTRFTPRYLEKKFKAQVGLTPKEFSIILKIRGLVDELRSGDFNNSFSELAYEYGFYDQSHLIKTFSGIVKTSPTKFNSNDYILPAKGKGY